MSIEAMTWALSADVGDATGKLVLIGQANHAHKDGRNAWVGKDQLGEYANCDPRTVQRHLKKLRAAGWIRPGDQAAVAHIRADRRPVVYDVAMSEAVRLEWKAAYEAEQERGDDLSPRRTSTAGQGVSPSDVHGETDGETPRASRGDKAVSPEPSLTQELPPNPRRAGERSCSRHKTTPGDCCRACGTTPRQLEAKRARDLAEVRRAADAAAALNDRLRRTTEAVPLPADLKAQARNEIRANRRSA